MAGIGGVAASPSRVADLGRNLFAEKETVELLGLGALLLEDEGEIG